MDTITTSTPITPQSTLALGVPAETLAASFARNVAEWGAFTSHGSVDGYLNNRSAARRKIEGAWYQDGPDAAPREALTLGEVFALYVERALDEIDDAYYAGLDELFARNEAGTLPSGPEFKAESNRLARRTAAARTKITKAAYGLTYTQFSEVA